MSCGVPRAGGRRCSGPSRGGHSMASRGGRSRISSPIRSGAPRSGRPSNSRCPKNPKFFFFDVCKRDVKPKTVEDANLFFDGAVEVGETDGRNCLYQMENVPDILGQLTSLVLEARSLLVLDLSSFFSFLKVLKRIQETEGTVEKSLSHLLLSIIQHPGVLDSLWEIRESFDTSQVTLFLWFVKVCAKSDVDVRRRRIIGQIYDQYHRSQNDEARRLANILGPQGGLETQNGDAGSDVHDNCFDSIQDISIVPTAAEVLCETNNIIPYADAVMQCSAENRESVYLDRHFRVLREDLVLSVKDSLSQKNTRIVKFPFSIDTFEVKKNTPCLLIKISFPRSHFLHSKKDSNDKIAFLEKSRSFFPMGSLACVCGASSEPLCFATVVWREPKEMVKDLSAVPLGISAVRQNSKALLEYCGTQGARIFTAFPGFFSIEPILKSLQDREDVPFRSVLLDRDFKWKNMGSIPTNVKLDHSQNVAFSRALLQPFSLIQGPPGTGKTYVGVEIAKELVGRGQTVLCVCYTNHALDQFLESILKEGINDICRIGGGSKNVLMDKFHISQVENRSSLTKQDAWRRHALEESNSKKEKRTQKVLRDLSFQWGRNSWKWVKESVPEKERRGLDFGKGIADEGFELIGGSGKKINDDYLFVCWISDTKVTDSLAHRAVGPLWKLSKEKRREKLQEWEYEFKKRGLIEEAERLCGEILENCAEIRCICDSRRSIPQKVIGCTTTGAAKFFPLISKTKIDALIVEEAGEVLEAHVFASLFRSLSKVVLIGDHKQLRPKIEQYCLSVAKGDKFDLNRSVFERLVLEGFPVTCLENQHRMRPEFSKILRTMTYPSLQDSRAVRNQPASIRGVQSNFVFINHSHCEVLEPSVDDDLSLSKRNTFEAEMVLKIVRHLLFQGYGPSEITVLTPYLGQLVLIKEVFSKAKTKTFLDARDIADVRKQNDMSHSSVDLNSETDNNAKSFVRVATIDNFQGEENNIIVASLVRSNPEQRIGFLKEPERVNVLFSRCRFGMFVLGDLSTLCRSRLWEDMRPLLTVYSGLPVKCERHPNEKHVLSNPEDFEIRTPQGGCSQSCSGKLACGHSCHLSCHPDDDRHRTERCTKLKSGRCSRGHFLQEPCWKFSSQAANCSICAEIDRCKTNLQRATEKRKKIEGDLHNRIEQLRIQNEARIEEEKNKIFEIEAKKRIQIEQKRQELELEEQTKMKKLAEQFADADLAERKEKLEKQYAKRIAREERNAQRTYEQKKEQLKANEERLKSELEKDILKEKDQVFSAQKAVEKIQNALSASLQKADLSSCVGADLESLLTRCLINAMRQNDMKSVCNILVTRIRHPVEPFEMEKCSFSSFFSPFCCSLFSVANMGMTGSGEAQKGNESSALSKFLNSEAKSLRCVLNRREVSEFFKKLRNMGEKKKEKSSAIRIFSSFCALILNEDLKQLDSLKGEIEILAETANSEDALALSFLLFHSMIKAIEIYSNRKHSTEIEEDSWKMLWKNAVGAGMTILVFFSRASSSKSKKELPVWVPESPGGEICKMLESRSAVSLLVEDRLPPAPRPTFPGEEEWTNDASVLKSEELRKEWQEKKRQGEKNSSLDKIMALVGLNEVKQEILNIYSQRMMDKKRGIPPSSMRLHARFEGSAGIGKTTVARLYCAFLQEMDMIKGSEFVETSGTKLINERVDGLKKILDKMKSGDGGALFVDEAYSLNPSGDPCGRSILEYLLTEMENHRDKLVICFAGYRKDMEKLVESNEGLVSRFGFRFSFSDYSNAELKEIFYLFLKKRNADLRNGKFFVENDKIVRIAMKRLGRQRESRGFGNARAVETLLEKSLRRQGSRIQEQEECDPFALIRQDLLGPKASKNLLQSSSAYKKLQALIGLSAVKKSVDNLLSIVQTNAELEEQEKELRDVSLNRVFLGNPGTGKTTVAKLYAAILYDLGLLSKGEIVSKTASDFIGSVVGESEKKTQGIIRSAEGCCLLIDEAYGLNPSKGGSMKSGSGGDPFRSAVIDTIVEFVQNVPGSDQAVILIGYKNEMEELMRVSNVGLTRRFNMSDSFTFEDFSEDELREILRNSLKSKKMEASDDAMDSALSALKKEKNQPHFGNAGSVSNLLSRAISRREQRLKESAASTQERVSAPLEACDFDPDFIGAVEGEKRDQLRSQRRKEIMALFDDLYGLEEVKETLSRIMAVVEDCEDRGTDFRAALDLNFCFVGPPGTGKTTVARKFGKFFHRLGVLASSDTKEIDPSHFLTGYVGQSAGKTKEEFEKALGKVLFIDEAYGLNPKNGGQFMSEVVDEIVKLLTDTAFKGKMVLILAGYEEEIQDLLSVNAGLKSRMPNFVRFSDLSLDSVVSLFEDELKSLFGVSLDGDGLSLVKNCMREIMALDKWGNARDVKNLVKKAYAEFCERKSKSKCEEEEETVLAHRDILSAFESMSIGRAPKDSRKNFVPKIATTTAVAAATAVAVPSRPPPMPPMPVSTSVRVDSPSHAIEPPTVDLLAETGNLGAARDAGVSEETYAWLLKDFETQCRQEEDLKRRIAQEQEEKRRLEEERRADEERKRRIEEELRRIEEEQRRQKEEAERRRLEEQKRRLEEEARKREAERRRLEEEARKREAERRRLEEQTRHEQRVQQRLRSMGVCPAGYQWIKQSGGYRCAGGSHFVDNSKLGL